MRVQDVLETGPRHRLTACIYEDLGRFQLVGLGALSLLRHSRVDGLAWRFGNIQKINGLCWHSELLARGVAHLLNDYGVHSDRSRATIDDADGVVARSQTGHSGYRLLGLARARRGQIYCRAGLVVNLNLDRSCA